MGRADLLVKNTVTASSDANARTSTRWPQLQLAKELLPEIPRFYLCNHTPKKRSLTVSVYARGERGWFNGLYQCSSVWICPICAPRIAERRRHELQDGINNAVAQGLGVSLVTHTFPHGAADALEVILEKFTKAQRTSKSGRAAKTLHEKYGFIGEVRTLEVTHGQNGWHPHAHSIWITKAPLSGEQQEELRADLYHLWLKACLHAGLPEPSSDHGVDVRGARYAGEYVAKWGFATEISGGNSKRGKNGSRTPWQLLADAADGDPWSAKLWREFALAFFGKRQLFWSREKVGVDKKTGKNIYRSIRERLNIAPELTDQQVLDIEEPERQVAVLDLDTWHCVRKSNSQQMVLALAINDPRGLYAFLNNLRSTVTMEDGKPPGPKPEWEY